MPEFTGTVVSCETRFQTKVKSAIPTHFDANWVVTVDVEEADADAPAKPGQRISFLFHSPTHTFFERAEDVAGRRWRFHIDRHANPNATKWTNLVARPL